MTKPPRTETPSLTELRREIDRIDEAMHGLLMERGEIIDRLIATKKTQESGSAFRPAREAEMMRRLVDRHKGILPLDTVESIWRVIISTFTYVQAPFSVHADLSAGDAAMRDSARFHFGFTVPFVAHMGAAAVVAAPYLVSAYWLHVLNDIGIAVIGAIGLNILVGYTGQISLGQAGFLAVGAYTAGLISITLCRESETTAGSPTVDRKSVV